MRTGCLRIWILLLALLLALACCGCSRDGKTTAGTTTAGISPAATTSEDTGRVSPEPSPAATPTVTAKPVPTSQTGETDIEEKITAAPEIEGAEKSAQMINELQRVVYLALPDNPYGLAVGTLIGEYKHEVFLGEEQTGGVALAAPVVQAYLERALEAIPAQQERWLLTLPMDLTDCRSLRPVVIDLSAKPLIDRPYYIRISAENEQVGVVNILGPEHPVVIDPFNFLDLYYVISERSLNSMRVIEGEEMAFLFVIVKFHTRLQPDAGFTFGDRVGTTTEPILAGLTSVRGPMRVHDFDCILKIDGCPVFLMANRQD